MVSKLQFQFSVCAFIVGVCMLCVCMHPSGFVQAVTSTFMHGFQNNLAQLFSLRSRNAI